MSVLPVLVLSLACCTQGNAAQSTPESTVPKQTRTVPAAQLQVAEVIYKGGFQNGWMDFGWSTRKLAAGGSARIDMSDYGGWILARPGTEPKYGGVSFSMRVKDPKGKLILFLKSNDIHLPRVDLTSEYVVEEKDGRKRVFVPMSELNPDNSRFDQVVIMGGAGKLPEVEIDEVALTTPNPAQLTGKRTATAEVRTVEVTIDCGAEPRKISPYIYGIAFDPQTISQSHWTRLGATARRWGGNPSSRYNWKLGNAWNTASDWYFRNVNYTSDRAYSWRHYLAENEANGLHSAITLPMLGWVAKDTGTYGFPVARFGAQRAVDPGSGEGGDGHAPDGTPLVPAPPTLTSVEARPEFIAEWVKAIRTADGDDRSATIYILDNEPMIWSTTHRDVHPTPLTFDELWDRTVRYATAVREADPGALIAGPAEWGWTNYFYSDADVRAGVRERPDRRMHGDVPLVEWYLQQARKHEEKTGTRLLDLLDLHFYPQAEGVAELSRVDRVTNETRLRSTRSLWDPTYTDESWIDEKVRLIPRMQEWIAKHYPGLGTMIGEYKFGGERHMSGGLAQAEALGRFGQFGLTAAFYWTYPADNSPVYWAFRAYRNYDGKGAKFGPLSLPVKSSLGESGPVSVFASRDELNRKLVLVALNLDGDRIADTRFTLSRCAGAKPSRVFQYAGDPSGLKPVEAAAMKQGKLQHPLPPWSISVLEVDLGVAAEGGGIR